MTYDAVANFNSAANAAAKVTDTTATVAENLSFLQSFDQRQLDNDSYRNNVKTVMNASGGDPVAILRALIDRSKQGYMDAYDCAAMSQLLKNAINRISGTSDVIDVALAEGKERLEAMTAVVNGFVGAANMEASNFKKTADNRDRAGRPTT
jgi:hypothetical protein